MHYNSSCTETTQLSKRTARSSTLAHKNLLCDLNTSSHDSSCWQKHPANHITQQAVTSQQLQQLRHQNTMQLATWQGRGCAAGRLGH
jgi:hypothetical protein